MVNVRAVGAKCSCVLKLKIRDRTEEEKWPHCAAETEKVHRFRLTEKKRRHLRHHRLVPASL